MTLEGTHIATLDRVTEGIAVLLVEDDNETIDERRIAVGELPGDISEGTVCRLTFEDGEIVGIESRSDVTADRRQRLHDRFSDLSRRLGEE